MINGFTAHAFLVRGESECMPITTEIEPIPNSFAIAKIWAKRRSNVLYAVGNFQDRSVAFGHLQSGEWDAVACIC